MASKRNFHGLTDSGVFYRDRDEWMRYVVTQPDLDNSVRLVALYIALRANPQSREPFPRQTTIAKELRLHVQTVKLAVAALKSRNLIVVSRRIAPGGRKPVNHYALIHPADVT
ncbi:MAG: hypothetical protein JJ864_08620 [Rhizobiaceae bacterium]|nr:hypothetical protein [Rhizobiaceae bacterium]